MSVRILACAVAVAVAVLLSSGIAAAQADPVSELSDAVFSAITPDTGHPSPRVAIDASGDATIEFAIRNADDDPVATRAGAMLDMLAVLRSVYGAAPVDGVRTVTVLGTFPFQGSKSPSVRPTPVLRAVLSADHAQNIDWETLSAADIPAVVDVWWIQGAFADVKSAAETQTSGTQDSRLTVAIAHLDEAIGGLQSGQVGVGRSQLTQFYDVWDDVGGDIAQRDPPLYDTIDVDLERAEVALLHRQPEDVDTALAALNDMRATLGDSN